MQEFSSPKAQPIQSNPTAHKYAPETIYSEGAVWLCKNRKTGYTTRIHGALAQILKKYPHDYKLRLLSIKERRHEHPAATGE